MSILFTVWRLKIEVRIDAILGSCVWVFQWRPTLKSNFITVPQTLQIAEVKFSNKYNVLSRLKRLIERLYTVQCAISLWLGKSTQRFYFAVYVNTDCLSWREFWHCPLLMRPHRPLRRLHHNDAPWQPWHTSGFSVNCYSHVSKLSLEF